MSLPLWGAWIETSRLATGSYTAPSLPLWGAWIETDSSEPGCDRSMSLPLWGAWIETSPPHSHSIAWPGRSPYGERGLKRMRVTSGAAVTRRSPYGERGLKLAVHAIAFYIVVLSLPLWGAWIETAIKVLCVEASFVAPPMGSVD